MKIKSVNPEDMAKPMGYSYAVSVEGAHKTVYIGGQNAVDEKGALVGSDSLKKQTMQILDNIEKIMQSAGGLLENVVKLNIYIVQGEDPLEGFKAFQEKWKGVNLPSITVAFIAGLGSKDWLVEIDGIGIIPE